METETKIPYRAVTVKINRELEIALETERGRRFPIPPLSRLVLEVLKEWAERQPTGENQNGQA